MATRFPKAPKVSLKALADNNNAHAIGELNAGVPFNKVSISRPMQENSRELSRAYKQASGQGPGELAPEETGLEDTRFFPIEFEDADGKVDPGAVMGRTTPIEMMKRYYGQDRAHENAVNLDSRNRGKPNPERIFPIIDPKGLMPHFTRPLHVVRGSGPAVGNGSIHLDSGVGHWQRSDDLSPGMVEHELAGHGPTIYSGHPDGMLNNQLNRDDATWNTGGNGDPVTRSTLLGALTADAVSKLDPEGKQLWTRLGGITNRALSERASDELTHNLQSGYHLRPTEMMANSLNWKNQALDVFGESLPGTKSKEISLFDSLLKETPGISPKFQTGPRAGKDANNFNFLHAQQQAIYRYFQAIDPERAKKYMELIYRLGGAGGVAVLPSLMEGDAGNDAGRNQ